MHFISYIPKNSIVKKWNCRSLNIGDGARGQGGGGAVAPSNENLGGYSPPGFGAEVRQVTNIRTMCEASNKTPVTKTLLGEVHKLLRLYLTLPVASATSERICFFPPSTQEVLRSIMKHDRLNKCLLMHCHKSITDIQWTLLRLQRGLLVPKNYATTHRSIFNSSSVKVAYFVVFGSILDYFWEVSQANKLLDKPFRMNLTGFIVVCR